MGGYCAIANRYCSGGSIRALDVPDDLIDCMTRCDNYLHCVAFYRSNYGCFIGNHACVDLVPAVDMYIYVSKSGMNILYKIV